MKNDNIQEFKMITFTPYKFSTNENENIQDDVIIFWVLSFMLSFDVIIFHGQRLLSFLCYYFSLYLLGVIIYVIIWCYHFWWSANVIIFMLSFSLIPVGCYHLCYHLIVIIYCYHFPPFFFFLKTWHTRESLVSWHWPF